MRQELVDSIKALFPEGKYDKVSCDVVSTGTSVRIVVSRMYEYVEVNFALLKKLSELLGTDEISDSRYSESGCESCDYGSEYTVTLTCKNCTVELT